VKIAQSRLFIVLLLAIVPSRAVHAVCVNGHPSVEQEYRQSGVDYLLFLSVRAGEPAMVDSCGNSGPVSETAPAINTVKHLSERLQ
jgi:hypothetical protein